MQEIVEIPWGPPKPRPSLTLELALTQGAMHSHYHRAQNIAKLRELGGTPLPADFIFWLWKGEPEPDWGQAAFRCRTAPTAGEPGTSCSSPWPMSWHAGALLCVPLGRHSAMRMSLAARDTKT